MIRMQLYIPEPLYADIKLRAQKEKRPAAELIRETLENDAVRKQFIEQSQNKTWGELATELNMSGGPKDLSRRLDDYLYGED